MAYTVTTNTSYGQRLKNAIGGVGMGFLLLIAGTILLFWNEGRTVKTTRMLKEAQGVCVELGDITSVNPEMNGKMIHATGFADTEEILEDGTFGLSLNAIKLIRSAEYYQWVEHTHTETRDKVGGGQETITTYTYEKEWVSSPVNSANFEDPDYRGIDNEVLFNVEDETWMAKNVSFGAYALPEGLVSQMSNREPYEVELSDEVVNYYETEFHKVYKSTAEDRFVHPSGNIIYLGLNPKKATVGDVRISYEKVLPGDVSILAQVTGNTFENFTAKNGYTLLTLQDGTVSMENMFASEHSSNRTTAWLLRLIGFLMIFFGLKNIFKILETLFKVLPFLADIVGMGVNIALFVIALAWTLIVIALGWIWYRPLMGILLLAIVVGLIWFFGKKGKEKRAAAAAAAAAAPAPAAPAPAPAAPAPAPEAPAAPAAPEAPADDKKWE